SLLRLGIEDAKPRNPSPEGEGELGRPLYTAKPYKIALRKYGIAVYSFALCRPLSKPKAIFVTRKAPR
ncbi:MAG: hypothetical protein ABL925_17875, partial [Methylococcales bacterium]